MEHGSSLCNTAYNLCSEGCVGAESRKLERAVFELPGHRQQRKDDERDIREISDACMDCRVLMS
jgi:hypothetical protein